MFCNSFYDYVHDCMIFYLYTKYTKLHTSYHALQDFIFNVKIRIYEYLGVCEIANINLNIGQGLLIKNRAKLTGFCFQNNLLWMLDERVSDI